MTTAVDRRDAGDRRVRRASLHFPERRTGFDRRIEAAGGRGSRYLSLIHAYRRSSTALGLVLGGIVALSALDLMLTLRALNLGATELNPVMAALLGTSPVTAGVFKLLITLAVVGGIWGLRRYRRVLELSLLLTVGLSLLLAYHLFGLTLSFR